MENTLENKAKFFAQYWGQEVNAMKMSKKDVVTTVDEVSFRKDLSLDYLYIKPISSITDEDAINVLKLTGSRSDKLNNGWTKKGLISLLLEWANGGVFPSNIYQYLQSKGYALPYMGLSVEKQIEYRWIKLIE